MVANSGFELLNYIGVLRIIGYAAIQRQLRRHFRPYGWYHDQ